MNYHKLLYLKPIGIPRAKLSAGQPARLGLALLLLAMCLSLVLPGQLLAVDGALDPKFKIGPGPYAGVQILPEIRGLVNYPGDNTRTLIFGTFAGVNVGGVFVQTFHVARLNQRRLG